MVELIDLRECGDLMSMLSQQVTTPLIQNPNYCARIMALDFRNLSLDGFYLYHCAPFRNHELLGRALS